MKTRRTERLTEIQYGGANAAYKFDMQIMWIMFYSYIFLPRAWLRLRQLRCRLYSGCSVGYRSTSSLELALVAKCYPPRQTKEAEKLVAPQVALGICTKVRAKHAIRQPYMVSFVNVCETLIAALFSR